MKAKHYEYWIADQKTKKIIAEGVESLSVAKQVLAKIGIDGRHYEIVRNQVHHMSGSVVCACYKYEGKLYKDGTSKRLA